MIKIAKSTDVGRRRTVNQDTYCSCIFGENSCYAAVLDGMGGQNGGEVASSLASAEIDRIVQAGYRYGMGERDIYALMETAAASANAIVHDRAVLDPLLEGMGTTIVLVLVEDEEAFILYAGDSRVYKLRPAAGDPVAGDSEAGGPETGGVDQLSVDHSVVQMMVERGDITPEEAKTHRERHYITRALGAKAQLEPDFGTFAFSAGDMLLLCSDGLYTLVDDDEFIPLALEAVKAGNAQCFIDRANQFGGHDNITAVLIYRE